MLPNAPSAVCARAIPSPALRTATFKPLICEVKRVEIAIPAASSLALLIRRPEDKRCNAVWLAACDLSKLRCALMDAMFVLIICGIVILLYQRFGLALALVEAVTNPLF